MTIRILGPNDPALDAISAFLSEHPDLDVELKIIPWADYQGALTETLEKQTSEFQAAFVPGHVWIPGLVSRGNLADLDALIGLLPPQVWERYYADDILGRIQDECLYRGQRYMIPLFNDGHILFFRHDLVEVDHGEKPPQVSPLEISELAARAHNPPDVYGLALKAHPSEILFDWLPYFYAAGGSLVDDALQPSFASEAGIKALEYYASLRQFCPPDTHQYGNAEIAQVIKQGKAAVVATWGGQAAPIFLDEGNPIRELYSAAVFPDPCGGTWGITIPANQPQAVQVTALEIILQLNTPDTDQAVLLYAGSPVRETTYSSENFERFSWLQAQHLMSQRLHHLPKTPEMEAYLGPLTTALVRAFNDESEVEQALLSAEGEILTALSE
jgi:multiple sugar transport system substrate-binding protein